MNRLRTSLVAVLLAAPLALTACTDAGDIDAEAPNVNVTPGDLDVDAPEVEVPDVEAPDVDVPDVDADIEVEDTEDGDTAADN